MATTALDTVADTVTSEGDAPITTQDTTTDSQGTENANTDISANENTSGKTESGVADGENTTTEIADGTSNPGSTDWAALRTKVANGDEKILNRLSRYGTLEEALKAGVEAQNKIGAIKKPLTISPESTPEEIAAYRKENNIPDSPDGYELDLGDGLVLGEYDKPIADEFLKVAHEHNLPPKAVNAIVAQQLKLQAAAVEEQENQDLNDRTATSAALTSEAMWGKEAKLNANLVANMLEDTPPGVREGLLQARLPNGKLLGNDVEAMTWLATTARKLNPYATVVPTPGRDVAATVEAEMKAIEAKMGTPEYTKDEAMQQRYRDLITIQQNAKKI